MSATPPSHRSEDEEEREDEEMSDLFGNDNDVDQQRRARPAPASPSASGPESERIPSPERERRQALEYEEEDAFPEMAIEVKEAEVKFPNLPVPRSSDGDNWVLRIPNYMSMDTKPFSPETYVGPDEEEDAPHHENTIKLKVENTLRWRWKKDDLGSDVKQSNARVIRWSDGTLSLRLGKELFDINQSIDTSAATPRQTIGAAASSQSQSQAPSQSQGAAAPAGGKGQGLTYLVAQHKRSQVLQSEALITGYMSLRPTGMTSETHRMLVRSVEQKHKQTARLRIVTAPTADPEREKMELMKQSTRGKSRRRNADLGEGFEGVRKRKTPRRQQDRDVYWSDDDEPEGMYAAAHGGSDDELDFASARSSPRKAKRKSDAEKDEEDYQADDFVVPDESEDEGGGRKQGRDQSEAEDDLERMEANLEKQAAAERKGRGSDGKKSKRIADSDEEDADGMDVESEEDADDHKVRRVTSKRAIAFDEDEDEE